MDIDKELLILSLLELYGQVKKEGHHIRLAIAKVVLHDMTLAVKHLGNLLRNLVLVN